MNLYFIIPVMNERETLRELTEGILANVADHTPRILFINDGSTDGSNKTLDEIAAEFDQVEIFHFRENRGKSAALAEGFARAEGDTVFTMDSDLQDEPAEIPRFLEALSRGNDLVTGWKVVRHDPWHKTLPSKVYNGFVCKLFGISIHDVNCGFKAMTLEVAESLELKHDYHRLIPVLAKLKGFTIAEIEVQHHARRYGQSKYGLARFWHGLRDVFRVWRDKNK
ncbi:MAG: glycosyltransferase family 2 protein [Candidatus Hydrogenedentota bacterium]